MESREAVRRIKDHIEIHSRKEKHFAVYITEALNMAVEALEKQTPKKPTPHKVNIPKLKIGNGYWGKNTTVYICPCCGEYISRTYKCCYTCGQKIDWSDTK